MCRIKLLPFIFFTIVMLYGSISITYSRPQDDFNPNEVLSTTILPQGFGFHFADVTGDGMADYISVVSDGTTGILVRPAVSTGGTFSFSRTATDFTGGAVFSGDRGGTFFADVTGDGMADAIAVNDVGIIVWRSTGSAFVSTSAPGCPAVTNANWTGTLFVGESPNVPAIVMSTRFADVTGPDADTKSRADAIAITPNGIQVKRSDGCTFSAITETWTSEPYFGNKVTEFADANGDGRADAIVVNDESIPNDWVVVRISDGSSFLPNQRWTLDPYYGDRGTYFADVTGDGRADAIVVNQTGITVRRSFSGLHFYNEAFSGDIDAQSRETWTSNPYFGSIGIGTFITPIYFADVTGDRIAEAIVINPDGIVMRRHIRAVGDLCQDDLECPSGSVCQHNPGEVRPVSQFCQ